MHQDDRPRRFQQACFVAFGVCRQHATACCIQPVTTTIPWLHTLHSEPLSIQLQSQSVVMPVAGLGSSREPNNLKANEPKVSHIADICSSSSNAHVFTTLLLQNTTDPELSGWGGIEDHLSKYDRGWVKDYADDIDTLLVFVRAVF